jgi:hypothetical protein
MVGILTFAVIHSLRRHVQAVSRRWSNPPRPPSRFEATGVWFGTVGLPHLRHPAWVDAYLNIEHL